MFMSGWVYAFHYFLMNGLMPNWLRSYLMMHLLIIIFEVGIYSREKFG